MPQLLEHDDDAADDVHITGESADVHQRNMRRLPCAGNSTVCSTRFYLTLLAMAGFALAALARRAGWPIAAVGVIAGLLRNVFVGAWLRLVTPMHVLAGGLWLGTLFVLVVAGMGTLLQDETERSRHGVVAADLVNAFSPLALVCGFLVVGFGAFAALRELEPFSALWTTPFGYTLMAKLGAVA